MPSTFRAFRYSTATLLLSVAVLSAETPSPKWKIEAEDRENVEARMSYEIHTTNFLVNRWMVYMPEPPELPSQTNVKVSGSPKCKIVAERSAIARKVRLTDLTVIGPSAGHKFHTDLTVQATLRTRKLVPLLEGEKPPKVTPLTKAEAKYYTSPGEAIDFNTSSFQNWLDTKKLHLKKGEQPIHFAERVLEVIRSDYKYKFTIGKKQASALCEQDTTDCCGMTYLFVGALRANDIPARALVGRLDKTRTNGAQPTDSGYDQTHIRAEFYVNDVGWVPADPAYANGNKVKKVREFIGNDPGDLLVLHVDVDFKLPYVNHVQTAECLQSNPSYWTYGKGQFDGAYGDTGWELTKTPIKKK